MNDFLNTKKLRNQENTNTLSYNCGGFALNTFNWYFPYTYDRNFIIDGLVEQGYTEEDICDILLEEDCEVMLNDFKNKLRRIYSLDEVLPNEDIVAYRIFVNFEEEDNDGDYILCADTDFHFRVCKNGIWMEKNGDGEIHSVDDMSLHEPWHTETGYYYNSPIILFAIKN